ncbi:hypothetical protein H6F89_25090 [Cyanobacteria bacterium FACHB-63]|nr:hypothetical protein [Cyanobacteria bacterium FACHB-63]
MNRIKSFTLISSTLIASLAGVTLLSLPSQARNRCRTLWEHLDPTMQCQVTEFRGSSSPAVTGGYYKSTDRPEVYAVNFTNLTYCHVQNPSQMNAFGGFNQVKRFTPTVANEFFSSKKFVGECRWGNGLYKRQHHPEVFHLFDNGTPSACWVRTSNQVRQFGGWNKVRSVDDSSDLKVGRTFSEQC